MECFKYKLISLPQHMYCDTFIQGLHGGGEAGEYARTGARHVKPGCRPGVVIQGTQGQGHRGRPLGALGYFGNLGQGLQSGHPGPLGALGFFWSSWSRSSRWKSSRWSPMCSSFCSYKAALKFSSRWPRRHRMFAKQRAQF